MDLLSSFQPLLLCVSSEYVGPEVKGKPTSQSITENTLEVSPLLIKKHNSCSFLGQHFCRHSRGEVALLLMSFFKSLFSFQTLVLAINANVSMPTKPFWIELNIYLRGFSDVEVGLLFGFTELPQMEDHQLVLLLVWARLQSLRAWTHKHSKPQDCCVTDAAFFFNSFWKKSIAKLLLICKCAFPHQRPTSPELAQKSRPARYQSAGRDIFGWLASLWVGRDLKRK